MLPLWSPRLLGAHAVGLLLALAAVGLGVWQFQTWQDHRIAQARDITNAAPVPLQDVLGADDPFPGLDVGRPVQLTGRWVPQGTVYVKRDQGYWIVTPVAVDGSGGSAIPVVRGLVEAPAAPPPASAESISVTGWLQPPEGSKVVDDDTTDDVLPQLRIADVIQRVDQDLYGGYVISQDSEPGLQPATLAQLPKADTFTGLRNFLYGLEWWVFGIFAIFLWWRYVQEIRAGAPAGDQVDDDVGSLA